MESQSVPDPQQAADALGLVGETRGQLADRLVTPWWYHPALGLSLALLIASWSTHDGWLVLTAVGIYVAALVGLPRLYRRVTGVWVNGLVQRRARRWAVALGWTGAVGLVLGIAASWRDGLWPLGVASAVAVFVLTLVFGRRFDEELRAELREDPDAHLRVEARDA
jgi:hypothetical protein